MQKLVLLGRQSGQGREGGKQRIACIHAYLSLCCQKSITCEIQGRSNPTLSAITFCFHRLKCHPYRKTQPEERYAMFSPVSLLSQLIVLGLRTLSHFRFLLPPNSRNSSRICTSSALDLLSLLRRGRNKSRTQGTGQPRQYHEICEGGHRERRGMALLSGRSFE
jgi:hypothetical protein